MLMRGAVNAPFNSRAEVRMHLVPVLQHALLDFMALGVIVETHRRFGHAGDDIFHQMRASGFVQNLLPEGARLSV